MTKAAETRQTILVKALDLIYTKGYQTTSVDDIIATTKVTKGAFYYHFRNKDEMGLAIINELVKPGIVESSVLSLKHSKDPLKEIYNLIKHLLFDNPFLELEYGCPIGNLAQEMTPWNAKFSKAISQVIDEWQSAIVKGLDHAKANGTVRKNVNSQQVAYFIMSGYWGIRNFGKAYNSDECYHAYLKELKSYLNSLK